MDFLQAIKEGANVIRLPEKQTITLSSPIILTRSLEIIGNDSTLIMSSNNPHFIMEGNIHFRIKNLSLKQGKNKEGGSIVQKHSSSVLTLDNVSFINNKAMMGGAIYSLGTVIGINCLFKENYSSIKGGAIMGRNVILTNSQLLNNGVSKIDNASVGGAIFIEEGLCNLIQCILNYNAVRFSETEKKGGFAGAVFLGRGTLNIINSSIKHNQAYSSAAIQVGIGEVSVINSSISNNQSFISGNATGGGAIVILSGNVNIKKSTIFQNKTKGMFSGSIVSFLGNINIDRSFIAENENSGPGGAIAANFNSSVSITNSQLSRNIASSLGSAIVNFSLSSGDIFLSNNVFEGNVLNDKQVIGETIKAFLEVIENLIRQYEVSLENFVPFLPIIEVLRKKVTEVVNIDIKDIKNSIAGVVSTLLSVPVTINTCRFSDNLSLGESDCLATNGIFTTPSSLTISDSKFVSKYQRSKDKGYFITTNSSRGSVTVQKCLFSNPNTLHLHKEASNYAVEVGINNRTIVFDQCVFCNKLNNINNTSSSLVLINTDANVKSTSPYISL